MKHALFAGIACLALSAGTAMAAPAPAPAATAPAPASAWKPFAQATIDRWLAIDPAFAVYQGAHQYDGKLPDWSEAGLKARADFLRSVIRDAGAFTGLSPEDAFERDYLVQVARGQLFWLVDADQPHTNPAFYVGGGLDPNVYVSRDYADKATRMKAMIAFFKAVPDAARNIRANLKAPMPASFVKYGVAGFGGFGEYYRGDARAAFADVPDAALQAEFKAASEAAAAAMDGIAEWLRTQQASATQDFALGPDRFARMVRETEGVDASIDELERVGRADLKRNQEALKAACARFAPGQTIPQCFDKLNADKPAEGPVAAAAKQIPELTAFVRAKDLATIPGTEQALVRESPPYNRQNSAYIDPPGPFEKGIPSIYYISPPDPAWSPEKQRDYIPGKDDLLFTSVHEVMPGHFLQFLHSNRSPSWIGRLFVGYAFAEGWAHYTEEMMWEAGLGDGDAGVHVGQISNALLRNCRYLSAIGLHARGMTQAQSQAMFEKECYQTEGTAEQQAARGTYDPAYLNYTLGKLMIRKLRADWTAPRGGRAAWKAFHDEFLSYGGPPIPLVRQAMMHEAAPHAVF
ncbi:DUF885 domain-containing protein [Novosphingobium album (ex Liu et al. 2023)]|uniref:DUF885 domain-containing protein n=1 Tax=Novosphingobium album (ex Liu et al. 2023) TaxID=3031130 RepID=A0ABT5WNL7_9SPHN|nr:DUF885 domain-containing protein [Novosphingobium album (ex Liu et al. 2023)]MDE8650862.1 DUF885 domain-containing protein [Novosphingobium album (ex Liu et al. 2023)]